MLKAAELRKQGFASRILLGSPTRWYGREEGELGRQYGISRGYPPEWFEVLYFRAQSTREEVQKIKPELQRRRVHRLIAVTSDFHTRRAGKLLRDALEPAIVVRIVAAPYAYFTPDDWWKSSEGRKTVFAELTKIVTNVFRL